MGTFLKSAREPKDYFDDGRPQICFVGRSNAGKSSLINALAQNNKLAKTSSTPGHTKLVNFFSFVNFVLVDLPGYGYAKDKNGFDDVIFRYLEKSNRLVAVVQLCNIDVITEMDRQMASFLAKMPVQHLVVLTKVDRVAKSHFNNNKMKIARYLGVNPEQLLPVSAKTRENIDYLFKVLGALCRKEKNGEKI